MAGQRFCGTIEAARGGGAFVLLPEDVLAALGGGKRFRVTGTLNGVDFASSTMSLGDGRVCLGVHKATRQAAAVDIGDEVELELAFDERPREVSVPDELAAALAAGPVAAAAFEAMSFTRRREHAESIAGAKRAETRARRLAATLEQLRP